MGVKVLVEMEFDDGIDEQDCIITVEEANLWNLRQHAEGNSRFTTRLLGVVTQEPVDLFGGHVGHVCDPVEV